METLALRDPLHRVSPRARWYWALRAAAFWIGVLLVELGLWGSDIVTVEGAVVVSVTLVTAAAHLAVMPQWRYRVHRWESTDTAVYTQSGWLTQERRIAPVTRIQTVDTNRGPIQQLFKLADVTITTASAAGPLHIRGLDRTVADRLVDELTDRSTVAGGDGT